MALARSVGYIFRRASAYGSLVSKANKSAQLQNQCSPVNQSLFSLSARCFSVSSTKSADKTLRYSEEHEWVRVDGSVARIGVTDHAQNNLGDVVYVEQPELGMNVNKGDSFGSLESVKAVADLYAPVSGEIVSVNKALEDQAELINEDPYQDGWIVDIKMSDPSEVDGLMTDEAYARFIEDNA